ALRMGEAVDLIQGEPGTKVTLTLARKGAREPLEFTLTRAVIKVQSILGDQRKPDTKEWEYLYDKKERIAYVRLTQFTKTTAQELREVLQGLEKDAVRGLVLDLRNNPGGLLRSAVEVADLFLTEGVIVSTRGRNHKEETFRAKAEGTLLEGQG